MHNKCEVKFPDLIARDHHTPRDDIRPGCAVMHTYIYINIRIHIRERVLHCFSFIFVCSNCVSIIDGR